ncbi:hypothetical protein KKG45_13260 [bacterium]|nr:hypothetical protein [bacterium]MBU1074209.1 hypothetical protein [bacterium]MBU1674895.1 hypothetical protein [bacterium]
MEHDIAELMRLTRGMSDALDRDALDLCADLLAERGDLLATLAVRYGSGDEAVMPDDLREALTSVRAQDDALEARLAGAMKRLGRQIGGLKEKTRQNHGGNSPICLNRRV